MANPFTNFFKVFFAKDDAESDKAELEAAEQAGNEAAKRAAHRLHVETVNVNEEQALKEAAAQGTTGRNEEKESSK